MLNSKSSPHPFIRMWSFNVFLEDTVQFNTVLPQEKQIPRTERATCCCCCRELPAIRPNKGSRCRRENTAKAGSVNYHLRQRKPGRNPILKKQSLCLIAGRKSQKTMFPRIPHGPNLSPPRLEHVQRLIHSDMWFMNNCQNKRKLSWTEVQTMCYLSGLSEGHWSREEKIINSHRSESGRRCSCGHI